MSSFDHSSQTGSRIESVRVFSLIAIFILIIACVNFMNLSTAKASRRMKEIGVKKAIGAEQKQLFFQFLFESVLLSCISMVFAMMLALALLPAFNQITGKKISLSFDLQLLLEVIVIALVTGLLAGSYPAVYLSKLNPLTILKGKLSASFAEVMSRKGLVVFQFTLSTILIVAVVIVYQQVQFIQSKDPGYHKENVIRFDSEGKIQGTEEVFVERLKNIPGVISATYTFNNMVGRNFGNFGIGWEGKNPNDVVYFEGFGTGYDFVETMGMKMQSGRSFSRDYGADSSKLILNEAAVNRMHIENVVGKTVTLFNQPVQVVGVVKDFHFESLHEMVKPSYFFLQRQGNSPWFKIMTRIKADHQQQTIAAIQDLYQHYNPGFPFTFNFLDQLYQKQYDSEKRSATLCKYFAGLAVIICCLGLFGLAAFTAQKRSKEISIRKVIGASVSNIVIMLSEDFLKLIMLSLAIAFPISWVLSNKWLQGFAYRISVTPLVFVIAGVAVIAVSLLTISFQSIRAAVANPVKSLRSD